MQLWLRLHDILLDLSKFQNQKRNNILQNVTKISFYSFQTLINMAYCCLILLGKSIQKVVFGELRISEQQVCTSKIDLLKIDCNFDNRNRKISHFQHLKDKFWNFVFYKFIFVFGVVNVQFLHEVSLSVLFFESVKKGRRSNYK